MHSNFNATPIRSFNAEPSTALSTLKSKVIVIHSRHDTVVPGEQVELVTKLAIAEKWAPSGKLSFYDSGQGHMHILDNPVEFAEMYWIVFEEQLV